MSSTAIVNALKKRVKTLSFSDISETEVLRKLKTIYYDNIRETKFSFETYLEVTSLLIILKSIKTNYRWKKKSHHLIKDDDSSFIYKYSDINQGKLILFHRSKFRPSWIHIVRQDTSLSFEVLFQIVLRMDVPYTCLTDTLIQVLSKS